MKFEIRYTEGKQAIREPVPLGTQVIVVQQGVPNHVSPAAEIHWHEYDYVANAAGELVSTESTFTPQAVHSGRYFRALVNDNWTVNGFSVAV